MPSVSPCGSWKSPITTDLIARKVISLMEVAVDGEDVYWIESHPLQGGRYTIMRRGSGHKIIECTPSDFYVRTTVHEYGGGAYAVAEGTLYFANYQDQHLYRQEPGARPKLLTPREGCRYADLEIDLARNRLICIREDHTVDGEPANTIVGVRLEGDDSGEVLVAGRDFYSSPRLSPDGRQLAYLTWSHPNMPWDGCELWLSDLGADGRLVSSRLVAGRQTESIFQPQWSPDGVLHFVAESSGWWNLYRWRNGAAEALWPMEAEFGRPQWQFAMSTYAFASASNILCCYAQGGLDHLAWLDTAQGRLTSVASSFTDVSSVRCGHRHAFFIAGSPTEPPAVVQLDPHSNSLEIVQRAFEPDIDNQYLSVAQPITFPTEHDLQSHAIYYPPRNKDCSAPPAELPPLLVMCHGGPTSSAATELRYGIQYWTSRGFAVVDVDYGGSSGYGREYRERLNGQWGIVDVDDCCTAARFLVEKGLVDGDRLAIRGGSAGGYTTLACLVFRSAVFDAGASYYGLAELERFARDTHKFESRYLSSLIGPYPQRKDLYFARSPIHFVDRVAAPLILFQGSEDKIVPPNQSETMFDALRIKGLPVAYLLFDGEQHGFRRAENITRSLEAEYYFYSRIFKFETAELIEPVHIENL
jgi:dipeptidyl aminopeptidase/acylaminoacyl peptidase